MFLLLKLSSVTPAINPQAIAEATAKSSTQMVDVYYIIKYLMLLIEFTMPFVLDWFKTLPGQRISISWKCNRIFKFSIDLAFILFLLNMI